jgi:hypothetical protein
MITFELAHAPTDVLELLTEDRLYTFDSASCMAASVQFERYNSSPNDNQGAGQIGNSFLEKYGDALNTALVGKDGYGYSMVGYKHLQETEIFQEASVRAKSHQCVIAAKALQATAHDMAADYEAVVSDDVSWLNQLVQAADIKLFVGISPYASKTTTHIAEVVGFATVEDRFQTLRPHAVVLDVNGKRGFAPNRIQLDGLYVLAK